jgi:1-acyl-sn-glycerol-3-phosphate acyltransferase
MNATEQDAASRLQALIADVARELRGTSAPDASATLHGSLDASLERDYGFDSLTRMELMHRAERVFGVTLGERALGEIDSARDLLREIGAAPDTTAASVAPAAPLALADRGAATDATTLVEALAWHAARHPDTTHVRFFADEAEGETVTYGDLWRDAEAVAAGLIARSVEPGESVVIMLPTGREYFAAFFGTLRAGGVPVPVYPPGRPRELEEHIRRHAKIVANARARLMITVDDARAFTRILQAQVEGLAGIVTVAELTGAPTPAAWPQPKPGDTAFIQYTSGSTGDPKGVVLTHANLMANIGAMTHALGVRPDDVCVSWLPLYHDMGLIGAWLGSLVHGVPLVLMSPLAFLARPSRWLAAISRYKGTISGAPNFAYEMCASRIKDDELVGIDLASWRVAFNGAEPVSAATMNAFAKRFAPYGFDAHALMPVYGLAENCVGLAFPPIGRGPKIDWIDREAFLRTGRAEPVAPGSAGAKSVPACGAPIPGHQLRVVDDTGRETPDRVEGRIQFHGPSSTSGYLRNPEANAALFDGTWLNSGDLGYTAEGEIYVTGRRKDMIIRAGRNIFPAELETAIGALDGISQGAVAVFGSPDPQSGTERLVVLAESRRAGTEAEARLARAITDLAIDLVGTAPDEVRLVPPRTVPKTSSGKIRRQAARAVFESGAVGTAAVRRQMLRLAIGSIVPLARRGLRRATELMYAGYVSLVGGMIALIGWGATALLPVERWRWRVLKPLIRLYCLCAGIGLVRRNAFLVPEDRPFIVAANHSSYFDGPVLMAALPGLFTYVAKAELAGHWFTRIFLTRIGTLFVRRFDAASGVADTERMIATLGAGRGLVTFPEGTLSRMAGLLPFQLGPFAVAVRSGAPVVPVVIRGTRHVLRDGTFVPRPGPITVEVLQPIEPHRGAPLPPEAEWAAAVSLRERTRAAILARVGEPDLVHERPLAQLAADARAHGIHQAS